ncbi:MAG: hypothetical protein ACFFD2_03770 [Promethearchaeota archaeon]
MGIISEIKDKLKTFISDLRNNLGLLVIITLFWIMLIFGILFLKVYVGPLAPHPGIYTYLDPILVDLLTSMVQVLISGSYVLIWLYLLYRLIRMYFWRNIKKYYPENESPEEN